MTKVSMLFAAASMFALAANANGIIVEFRSDEGGSETWEVCGDDAYRQNDGSVAESDWDDGNSELCLDIEGEYGDLCYRATSTLRGSAESVAYNASDDTSGTAYITAMNEGDCVG